VADDRGGELFMELMADSGKASVDMVYNFGDARKNDLIERIESRKGLRQLSAMKELRMGSDPYELITIN
jgi:uncharacterized Fe-S center protein